MKRLSRVLLWLAVTTLLATEALALLSAWIWQGEMITPFRVQLLTAAIAGLLAAAFLRGRWLMAVAAITLVADAAPMAARLMTRNVLPAHGTAAHHISLVFANVLCDNRQFGRVTDMVRMEGPDLFLAAETTPEWISHLDILKVEYPYSFAPKELGVFGVAAYAKRPFTAQMARIGRHRMPLLRLDFGDMIVFVAHPQPPARAGLVQENREYLRILARLAQTARKRVIIAGDLNASLWSRDMQPLMQASLQWPQGSGMMWSWPTDRPLMAIQIDQVLTKDFGAGTYRTLPEVGSDHFPIRAELDFQ